MIQISCECGKYIEYEADVTLYDDSYTPEKIVCSCCGAEFLLCIHVEYGKDGDPNKRWPEDDTE